MKFWDKLEKLRPDTFAKKFVNATAQGDVSYFNQYFHYLDKTVEDLEFYFFFEVAPDMTFLRIAAESNQENMVKFF